MVTDKNGVELHEGDRVRVYQEEETFTASIAGLSPDNRTIREPGWWVDVDRGYFKQAIPSYLLEAMPVR